jgi:DNA-binding MarR family transcriptional regulator
VALTGVGLELIEKVAAAHFANEEKLHIGMTATERRQLGQLLNRLERSVDVYEATERREYGGVAR